LLKFNLASLLSSVARATLYVKGYVSQGSLTHAEMRARGIPDDSWTELSTWNSAPRMGTFSDASVWEHEALGQITDADTWHAYDVTKFVRAEQLGDKTASIALVQVDPDASILVRMASNNAATVSNRPFLRIELGGPVLTGSTLTDAHVRGGTSDGTNYGSDTQLEAKNASFNSSLHRISYLDLALPQGPSQVVGSVVRIKGFLGSGGTLSTYALHDAESISGAGASPWSLSENTVTYANQPIRSTIVSSPISESTFAAGASAFRYFTVDPTRWSAAENHTVLALAQGAGASQLAFFTSSEGTSADRPVILHATRPYTTLTTSGVVASNDDGHIATNVSDGSLATRWSTDVVGAWIRFDLLTSKAIDAVTIAHYQPSDRVGYMAVEVSNDAITWTPAGFIQPPGDTSEPVFYPLKRRTARYLRLVGYGNSNSAWTSLTEVRISQHL
jgi:hypothetical protein